MSSLQFFTSTLYVGLGGFCGASLRYWVSLFFHKYYPSSFPFATLVVNTVGGFLIGVMLSLTLTSTHFNEPVKLFLVTGLLGSLTTFSTFSYETVQLFSQGSVLFGAVNILSNVFFAIIGVLLGRFFIFNVFQ